VDNRVYFVYKGHLIMKVKCLRKTR